MSEIHPSTHEYVYARVKAGESIAKRLLNRDGVIATLREDESAPEGFRKFFELVFYVYAASREEAIPLVQDMRALASQLQIAAADLEHFIETHDSPKWEPKEEGSPST